MEPLPFDCWVKPISVELRNKQITLNYVPSKNVENKSESDASIYTDCGQRCRFGFRGTVRSDFFFMWTQFPAIM